MMPTHITVIRGSDFVVATAQGEFNFEASTRLLAKIASVSSTLVAHEILLDMRKSESKLSVTDLWCLAATLSNHPSCLSQKIAILDRMDSSRKAEFFALCAQNRGFQIQAFTSFEDAFEWLIGGKPPLLDENI